MSRISGVWYFDARPPSPREEAQLKTALSSSGFSRPHLCRLPGLLMGWAAGANDPSTRGPFQDRGSGCLWDGRIDNAADLLRTTGSRPNSPDSDILMRLYRQKGVDGLREVVGDWSLCIWDADKREIVLASDYAGIRPLYYHRSAHALYWSSSLTHLVDWSGVTELDDCYLGGFLTNSGAPTATPYANIFAVPAGHAVVISRERIAIRAFWTLPVDREVEYADERAYDERMIELFREAVDVRLAKGSPTCSELSGGLDSSSVVCMANRLRKESPAGASGLISLSYTHENSADERFFREVERFCELTGRHLPMEQHDAASADQVGAIPSWWEPRFRKLAPLMADMGSSVLLTGQLGDFVMGNVSDDGGQVTEWLVKGRIGKALRSAYAWGRSAQVPLYPILWRSVREACFSWDPSFDPRDAPGAIPASVEDSLRPGRAGARPVLRAGIGLPAMSRCAPRPDENGAFAPRPRYFALAGCKHPRRCNRSRIPIPSRTGPWWSSC